MIYPLTIISDRYNGSYSGALFLAFYTSYENIPKQIGSDDMDELNFWESDQHKDYIIGKGSTPQEAYINLLLKLPKSEIKESDY